MKINLSVKNGASVLIIVSFIFLFSGCYVNNKKTHPDHNIDIGVVLSLTGKGATYGINAKNGMLLAVEEINKLPPFNKNNIVLIVEDSNSSASVALNAFNKLIEINHVPVAVGFVLSDEVLTCAPVAEKKKTVLFTTAAGSDKIKDAGDYIFRNRESGDVQAKAIGNFAINKLGYKNFAVIYSNSANGMSYKDAFVKCVNDLGGSVVLFPYNEGNLNYRPIIDKLKKTKVSAVYLAGLDVELGQILKQSKEQNYSPQFLASAGGISTKLLEIAGDASEGLICGSSPFDISTSNQKTKHFIASYYAHYKQNPDFISANSYDAIYILANIYKQGKFTSAQIKNSLYKIKDFDGVGGVTIFDSNGEVTKPISIVRVVSKKYIPYK
ncbi:MAG: ABC transporter substrate-binding protein [Eubacteriaceae bacterium]|nr:ABC transporter substrate-binding protein [Eubacteriaceae bacterium]